MSKINNSSGFLGLQGGIGYNDETIQDPTQYKTENYNYMLFNTRESGWSRSGYGGGLGMCAGGGYDNAQQIWDWVTYETSMGQGFSRRKVVSGQVLNAGSSVVSGATVQLFNTATGALVDTATSDVGGNYRLGDPNAVNCFVVAYLSGSPDTSGTTVDTLTGT